MSNSITVSIIEGKLSPSIRREWAKEVNKTDSKVDLFAKFPHFMKFLLEQRSIFEYEMANLRITHIGGESDSGTVNHGTNFNSTKSENLNNRCIFHKSNGHSTIILHKKGWSF